MNRLTREQAAVVSLFTGILAGPFEDMHDLAEKLNGGPVWTHEFGDRVRAGELKELARPLFLELVAEKDGFPPDE